MNTTAAKIVDIITATLEDEETPDRVLAYLKEREGKKLTKRDTDKLTALLGRPCYLENIATMLQLRVGGPTNPFSLLLAYTRSTGPEVRSTWIEDRNMAYFAARKERNAKRREILRGDPAIAELANAINALNAAQKVIDDLTQYGATFHHDSTALLANLVVRD